MFNLLDKTKVASSFNKAVSTYDQFAFLQKLAGTKLLNLINTNLSPQNILDLGCGTGKITQKCTHLFPTTKIYGIDIAEKMISHAQKHASHKNLTYICADADYLPFANNSVDLVFSNLMLQWLPNLEITFNELNRVLSRDGSLFFSILGAKSLHELRSSWSEIDHHQHVYNFFTAEQLSHFLANIGFTDIKRKTYTHSREFVTFRDLLLELKMLGTRYSHCGLGLFGKTKWQQLSKSYEKFRTNNKLPVTYEIHYFQAKKLCKK